MKRNPFGSLQCHSKPFHSCVSSHFHQDIPFSWIPNSHYRPQPLCSSSLFTKAHVSLQVLKKEPFISSKVTPPSSCISVLDWDQDSCILDLSWALKALGWIHPWHWWGHHFYIGGGGMDLAWVLIQIRSLIPFLCSPVSRFFLIFFLVICCSLYSTSFFFFFLFLHYSFFALFCSLFLSFSFLFLRGDEDITIWRGVHVTGWAALPVTWPILDRFPCTSVAITTTSTCFLELATSSGHLGSFHCLQMLPLSAFCQTYLVGTLKHGEIPMKYFCLSDAHWPASVQHVHMLNHLIMNPTSLFATFFGVNLHEGICVLEILALYYRDQLWWQFLLSSHPLVLNTRYAFVLHFFPSNAQHHFFI